MEEITKDSLKGITLGENSDKALTDTSKFVFGLTFRPLSFEEDLRIKVETSGQKQTCWCL